MSDDQSRTDAMNEASNAERVSHGGAERPREPDLIKVTEIFLIPSSFLVAALGTADTYPHKAAVSALGLLISMLWLICSLECTPGSTRMSRRMRILTLLPIIFITGWLFSVVIHGWLSAPYRARHDQASRAPKMARANEGGGCDPSQPRPFSLYE